jgi:uncharacterized protein (TIGR02118 family)
MAEISVPDSRDPSVRQHTMVFATRRLPHLTHEQFIRHYEDVHAPLARQLPGLVEYRQMPVRSDYQWHGQRASYDAISVYVFESDEAASSAWASPQGVELDEDTGRFMDWEDILAFPGFETRVSYPAP